MLFQTLTEKLAKEPTRMLFQTLTGMLTKKPTKMLFQTSTEKFAKKGPLAVRTTQRPQGRIAIDAPK